MGTLPSAGPRRMNIEFISSGTDFFDAVRFSASWYEEAKTMKVQRPMLLPRGLRLLLVLSLTVLLTMLRFGALAGDGAKTEEAARGAERAVPLPRGIIDMHCHVAGIGAGGSGCFVSPRLRHSWRFRIYLRSFGVTESELLRQGDRAVPERISQWLAESRCVDQAVLLALDGVIGADGALDTNRTEVYVPNEFVAEAAAAHGNLLFGASINPYRRDALERLLWAKEHGAVLVKWIPSIMQIDPSDPRVIPFYEKMIELNLPLLTHAGKERSFSSATDVLCDPCRLELPLSLGVTVIAAHIASTGTYEGQRSSERLARMMTQYTNLYSDISSLTQLNKLRFMREALRTPEFSGRLIYGSDFPLINTALVSPRYYTCRLSPRQVIAIARERNPWDADVKLKQALGVKQEIFDRSAKLLLHRH
jgi:uncharacterized protein